MSKEASLLLEIQELKNQNQLLKKELESKKFLIDHLPCMVSWVTSDLKYISINKNLEEYLGMTRNEIQDKVVGQLNDQKNEFSEFIKEFFKTPVQDSQSEISSFVNNEHRYFFIRAQKYNNDQEAIVIGFDITDKRQIENQLQHNDKIKVIAELATSIVHEIKNPLMVIKGNCELLEHAYDELDDEKKISMVQKVHQTSDRIFTIIEGLKNLARDDFNDPLVKTPIQRIIDESLAILKSKLIKENIDFKLSNKLSNPNLEVLCVEGQIIQILVNLINNSIEEMFKYKERWIELKIENSSDEVHIRVIDSGLPIDKKILDKIFNPYYTTKPKSVGTGLGLSICLSLAKKNNATLTYQDYQDHPSFLFKLPY